MGDMGKVLVAYATRGGTARDIADTVGSTLRSAGHEVRAHTVCGPTFWQTTEIEECPALLGMSLAALKDTA